MAKLVQGWGINDLGTSTVLDNHGVRVSCPIYKSWGRMLERCFSAKWKARYPTYKDVVCCEDWKYFSNFKAWALKQSWENQELDKDLSVFGNRVYSPKFCIFIPPEVNKAISVVTTGKTLPGTNFQEKSWSMVNPLKKPWMSRCNKVYLGNYYSEIEAHNAWRIYRAKKLRIVAEKWKSGEIDNFSEHAYVLLLERAALFEDLNYKMFCDGVSYDNS